MIYLASPYTHDSRRVVLARYRAALSCAAALMRRGEIVLSPIAHSHAIAEAHELPTTFDFWMRYNFAWLDACTALVVLAIDGWRESRGVQAEIARAQARGMRVSYVDERGEEVTP